MLFEYMSDFRMFLAFFSGVDIKNTILVFFKVVAK